MEPDEIVQEADATIDETVADAPKVETVAEILNTEPKPKLVPESALISEKKGRKEAERKVKELEAKIAAGATTQDVSEDIDEFLNSSGVDDTNKQFFKNLAGIMQKNAEKNAEAKTAAKLAPIEERARAEQLDRVFSQHFAAAIETNPEYAGIANPAVIKTLSLDPGNANKTFVQIIEETYGGAIQGRRTIETATPRGGKDPEKVDTERMKSDQDYYGRVMADPAMKVAYNEHLLSNS